MAVNKIGFVEQHFEKVFAGIGAAALLGVLAWQFVGGRSVISLGKGNDLPLNLAYGRVADDANRLKGEMHSETPPIPEFAAGKGPFDAFSATFNAPVAGRHVQLADAFERYRVGDGIEIGKGGTEGAVVVPAIPAVATPTAHTFLSTISPHELEANPSLASLLPSAQPFDKAAISVEGRFDGAALLAALQTAPSEGQRQIPRGWWESQTAIFKVELMRQERKPDGSWTDAASVPPAPGREGLGPKLAELAPGADIVPVVAEAWAMEDAIQRPAWYERPVVGSLVVGDEWQPPIEAIAALETASDASGETVATLQRQLVAAKAGRDRAKKKLAELKQREAKPGASPQRGGAGGRGGSGGGRTPPTPTGGGSAPGTNLSKGDVLQQERLVKDAEDRVKRLEEKLAGMGVQSKVAPHKAPTGAETNSGAIFANASIQVWNHDLTVERGKTYRYMMKVWVTNPLFGKSNVGQDQKELAAKPMLASADSAWTDPVRVDDEVMFFFTSAQDRGESGGAIGRGAQASGELYSFAWGHWRRAAVALQPGDSPSGDVRVPDIEKIAGAAPAAGQPGGAPAGGDTAGKTKDAPRTTQESTLPTKPVRVSKDLVLLDAVQVMAPDVAEKIAGKAAQPFVAYVRDASGTIVVRAPDDERSGEVYRRLRNSANAGELALVVKPDISADDLRKERDAKKREEEKNKPSRPSGGGGGGGGGSGS